jgi:Flp pilus assembly protein TadD
MPDQLSHPCSLTVVAGTEPSPLRHSPATPSRRAICALLLALLVVVAYHGAGDNQFHLDDWDNVVDHPPVHMAHFSMQALWRAGTDAFLPRRPIPGMSFALDWWRGGGEPRAFLQTNVALHALTAIAVFGLLCPLMAVASRPGTPAWLRDAAAFAGAALWALHPLQVQNVSYVVQRMNMLATLFVVLGLLAWLHARMRARTAAPWMIASAAAFAAGALSKENAWVAPALLVLVEAGVVRHGARLFQRRSEVLAAALVALLAAWLVVDLASGTGPFAAFVHEGYAAREFTLQQRLLTEPRVLVFYLSLFLWPFPGRFSIEHDFALSTAWLSPPTTALAIAGLAVWCAAGLWLLSRPARRHLGMLVLWPVLTLAIESSVIALELVFEHRMYLPCVALCALVACALLALAERSPPARSAALALGVAMAASLLGATLVRVPQWRSDLSLMQDAVAHAPSSPRVWSSLSKRQLHAGDAAAAQRSARRALELDPSSWPALETLGVIRLDRGDASGAAELLERAMHSGGDRHSLLNHLGEAYFRAERYEDARRLFARAVDKAAWVADYRWNLALALEGLGECRRAHAEWRSFLALARDDADRDRVREHLSERYPKGAESCDAGGEGTTHRGRTGEARDETARLPAAR